MSFEWRTDEDDDWQEGVKQDQTAVSQSFLRRRWRFLLVALMGIAAVWLAVQWQINQRVTTATVEVESELLNTHNFVLQTAVDRDEDLFKSNLSGRDPEWGEVQKTLLNEGLFLDRPMLGWRHEPAAGRLTSEAITVTVAPDLRAAELLYPQEYTVTRPDGVTETVTLQHTAVYRLGERRWLYSPPLDDYWGDWITQGGDYLTVAYPERDREVAARLAIHLDQLIGQMCDELADLDCDSDLRFHLRLNTDPESLLEVKDIETMLTAGQRLELPTPTLVGLPTDEASYDVLYQAYGVQLATAVIAHQIDYDCCRHQLFFRALRDYQLAQLGLQAWPLTEAMFGQMLSVGFDGNVLRHWTRRWEEAPPQFLQVWVVQDPEPIWQQVYMLIEFLNEQETAVSPAEMMRLMDRNSYNSWLADVLGDGYDETLLETRFLAYIYAQTNSGQQAEPPIPFPNGEITLICNDYRLSISQIYAFDLASQRWNEKFPELDLSPNRFLTTPDGKNFILSEHNFDFNDAINSYRFFLITEAGRQLLEESDIPANNERYVNYYIWDLPIPYLVRQEFDEGERISTLRSLQCPTDDCSEIQLTGYPTFSPDGRYLIENRPPAEIVANNSQNPPQLQDELFVLSVDGKLEQPVGQGGSSFWLDNNTYGFVRAGDEGLELVTASLSTSQQRVLLREADLRVEIPSADASTSVWFGGGALTAPTGNALIIQALIGDEPDRENHLFRLQLTDDLSEVADIELLWKGQSAGGIGFSPDGRYLIIVDYSYASNSGEVPHYLLDLETRQLSEPFISRGYGLNWSPDGHWFVQNTNTFVLLHAPDYGYQYIIPHDLEDCQQMVLSVEE